MPIDDDTWGEFLIQQNGFDGKFNFIQHRNVFISVDALDQDFDVLNVRFSAVDFLTYLMMIISNRFFKTKF